MNEDSKVQDKKEEAKPQSDVHADKKQADDSGLPEGTSDRTQEQFEKLKKSNQELKEQLDAANKDKEADSVLDSLKAPAMPDFDLPEGVSQKEAQEAKQKLVDERGYVDANLLEKTLTTAQQEAQKAKREAQQVKQRLERYEETQQVREAHQQHPELDPKSDKFDEKYYNLVRNELIGQMAKGEKNLVKAASSVKDYYTPQSSVEEKKREDTQAKKQQINAGRGSGARKTSYEGVDKQTLIQATQRGDSAAIAERLKRAGY